MHDAGAWVTGRRRTVRAVAHILTGITIATIAWGFVFGVARRACKCEEVAPPTRLLGHGGALALVGLAVIAALTWVSWRAPLNRAMAATGGSMLGWIAVVIAWLEAGTQAPDAPAYQAQLATWLLGGLVLGRLLLDVALEGLERRARERPRPAPLPVGMTRRGR